jgi:outer membrane translocation and assembly module TamA
LRVIIVLTRSMSLPSIACLRCPTSYAEAQHLFETPLLVRIGLAAFTDIARVWRPLSSTGDPLQVDVGLGLRLRVPGRQGLLRVDYGRGIGDGRNALTFGWQF